MTRRHLIAMLAALPLIGVSRAFAQSPTGQSSSRPQQTARGLPGESVPNAEQERRERLHEEHERRRREYLATIGRMA
jgi:hypothetical protein